MTLHLILRLLLWIAYIVTVLATTVIILRENRKPVRALTWVIVLFLLPFVGLLFYYIFGQYYRRRKIISKKKVRKVTKLLNATLELPNLEMGFLNEQQRKLVRLLKRNNNSPALPCSKVDVLVDGEATFEAIFDEIERAEKHIHIEFYIFTDDEVSNRMRELLIKKAKQGVRVRMIYDYIGSFSLPKKYIQSLRSAGVYVEAFLPARFKVARIKINYRNHRKILVIDGKVGFTGGVNVADRYLTGNKLGLWRDTFVRLEGMAVYGLQANFLVDWYFVSQKLITDSKYYPPMLPAHDGSLVQVVSSAPDSDWENIMQGISHAIMTAEKYVYIHTPYFIPTDGVLSAIQIAALSGVDVRLMIPKYSDAIVSSAASRSYVEPMLEVGAKVYWYTGGFLHSKAIVIDDMISIVGSANLDERSTNLNFELSAFIYNKPTAQRLKEVFMKDVLCCNEIKRRQWQKRSSWNKLQESMARLFSPLM